MKYEYPAGVLPEERPIVERFEADVLPFVMKHGSEIGERAMQGDTDCEEVIRRHHAFIEGMPHLRAWNLGLLIAALKRWESRKAQ